MITVYYTSSLVPPELIAACGCRPRYLAGSCANGYTAQTEGMCGYTEAWLETLLDKAAKEPVAVVFATTCDQMRRAFELFTRRRTDHRAFLLNVPTTTTPQARDYFRLELQRLQGFLCSVNGTRFDERQLRQNLSKQPPQRGPAAAGRLRIALIGETIPDMVHQQIGDILSRTDAGVALDLTDQNRMTGVSQFDLQNDSLTALANRLITMPAVWQRPDTPFYRMLEERLDTMNADGVILFRYVFCDLWHAAAYELKQRLPMPVLEIDLDGGGQLSASAVSRLQAFGEMLTP